MRTIDDHKVSPTAEGLTIRVLDEPGAGAANYIYQILGPEESIDPVEIMFQNGPIAKAGVNGITEEALIAICIDRLRRFQSGPYKCDENGLALTKLKEAMQWLHRRTRARAEMVRAVEGML